MVIYHDGTITTTENVKAKVGLLLPCVKSVSQMLLPGDGKAGVQRELTRQLTIQTATGLISLQSRHGRG